MRHIVVFFLLVAWATSSGDKRGLAAPCPELSHIRDIAASRTHVTPGATGPPTRRTEGRRSRIRRWTAYILCTCTVVGRTRNVQTDWRLVLVHPLRAVPRRSLCGRPSQSARVAAAFLGHRAPLPLTWHASCDVIVAKDPPWGGCAGVSEARLGMDGDSKGGRRAGLSFFRASGASLRRPMVAALAECGILKSNRGARGHGQQRLAEGGDWRRRGGYQRRTAGSCPAQAAGAQTTSCSDVAPGRFAMSCPKQQSSFMDLEQEATTLLTQTMIFWFSWMGRSIGGSRTVFAAVCIPSNWKRGRCLLWSATGRPGGTRPYIRPCRSSATCSGRV